MMKRLKKTLLMGLIATMLLVGAQEVHAAASHIGACGSLLHDVQCTSTSAALNVPLGNHPLYTTANGTVVSCVKTCDKFLHNTFCSGCGALLKSGEARSCTIRHSKCPDEKYACQY